MERGHGIGMNYETSFEAEVLERTRYCEVWGYDYRSNSFGSIKRDQRAHFHPWGLANIDAHGPNDDHKLYTLKTLLDMNSESSLQPYSHHGNNYFDRTSIYRYTQN
jgi:hypothetical protein